MPRKRSWQLPSTKPQSTCCFILLLLISSVFGYNTNEWIIFYNKHIDQGMEFEKMVVDPSNARLYVAGVNYLYDLHSSDLSVRVEAVTGPMDDSDLCKGGRNDSCSAIRHKTNSHAKALAVYDKSSQLIECTSLFQGRCRLRNLHNISDVQIESPEPMIANDAASSAVVFVGNGPSGSPVLYVGTTFVRGPLFRDDIPAITSLRLSRGSDGEAKEFELADKGLATGTEISLERKFRSSYRIDYVGGFESGKYAYFATRQGKTLGEDAPIQSRLVRVCTGDSHFYSYTEVMLECIKDDFDYNLIQDVYVAKAGYNLAKSLGISEGDEVLYGVFVADSMASFQRNVGPHHCYLLCTAHLFLLTRRSAVCVYPMQKRVEKKFEENIMDCYRGLYAKQLPWFKSTAMCKATHLSWKDVECGQDVNTNIGGGKPISAEPLLTVDDARFTAIAVNTTRGATVAFIGTDDGRILKVNIHDSTTAEVYATEEISQNEEPVLADLDFSENGQFAYVLTPSKVVKMRTSNCGESASTCAVCLSKRDPFCGWCVKNSICTEEDTCERVLPKTNSGWLDFQNNRCPNIKGVLPDKIQITTADFLNVSLENMGDSKGRLQCSFRFSDGKVVNSDPVRQDPHDGTLRCATPPINRLPMIPRNSSHHLAILSIVAEGRITPIASTNFSFFDCSRYNTCSQCTKSEFPCDWCLESNECVAGKLTEDKCRKQHIVNGLNRDGHSRRKGPQKCPHIVAPQPKLYVAVGEKRNISVKVQNLDPIFMVDFRCQFRMNSIQHEKPAIKTFDDNIICDEMHFDYYSIVMSSGTAVVEFNVLWSSSGSLKKHMLDNINGLAVEVYKCELLASNCGQCLTLDMSKYDCGWCISESRCVRPQTCLAKSPQDWLNSTQLCANPTITDFNPKKGPVGGKTKLRIIGSNLGRNYQDVSNAVVVANVQCTVIPSEYHPATKIVCETGKAAIKNSKGPVVVRLRADDANYAAVSKYDFEYVEPAVSAVKPDRGPISGGTDVTLYGTDLDAGSDVHISFGEVNCEILSRKENLIVCRMGPGDSQGVRHLRIDFDGSRGRVPFPVTYSFALNPRVATIIPAKTIVAGGVQIDVRGEGFALLQRPNGVRESGPVCDVEDDGLMICLTPGLPYGDAGGRLHHNFAFDFDGTVTESRQFEVYPNPTVDQFAETRYYRPGDNYLTINGEDLNIGVMERDIKITVGGVDCQLTALARKVLTCKPPTKKPPLDGGLQPEVVVKIGNLSYDSPSLTSNVVMVILGCIAAMLICFICLAVMYRRKTNSHQRQMKYLKTQMDTIEMKVATECKEAFAELQTSLNQYTADLPLGTPIVPFLEYKDYCARVLFPNNPHNHPVLHDLEVDSQKAGTIEAGLREFHKLLMNKTFFLTMVRTMESNKYFLGKDRVYVGSLLMVVLQKMGYCTEMLKQLLRELIDRTVEKKFQPKILFRRSESVAERMLAAWFTFLLHDYLRNFAGKRLYDLYWGIKQQMEKGPQDALTLEARYSLSEEKLLRATFEYKELVVFITADSMAYTQPDIPVRVLDCDTITQVKEKCLDAKYRTVPYSDRPNLNDLDLEWRSGQNGRMILQDIDSTSKVESGGWKRLNTLSHYNVPNNAILMLLPKQNSLYNLDGEGHKLFHLVKPTEHGPTENQEKMVTEIYLTRLLMMKGTLQKFINDLLETIFSTTPRSAPLPAAIKYMFDFMDEQALEHGIMDTEVVHAWKSNALPLRFWVNLIKNPHFVFDIQKPTKVEGCLSVVAQTLMDACSTQDHQLTKDSPSSKLLFAKDMYQYRDWVDSYYSDIARLPPISDQDMAALLNEESRVHRGQFHVFSALNELYKYLDQYKDPIMDALEHNDHAEASRLPGRLQDMLALMEADQSRTDYDSSTLGLGYNSNSRLMPRERL
ncbi:plexin cytoplasmic region [Dictyocaulus viviparus]|uniref:Plexin cytoplasmic region n=1 Tax=Dictyocaulus viviparus TaxID=29172 RepID=A0A0D8Y6E0_DICVI|nr:plexin cytoplasmic region [Dictyocaulus viviparus]